MAKAADGDVVRVHYTGTLANGAEFDSSRQGDPLQVEVGGGQLIPDFEQALVGMAPGDVKRFVVAPERAYGARHDAMVHTVALEQLPPELNLQLGMTLESADPNGQPIQFRVTGLDDRHAVLDSNHPLAGETLTFDIELMEILADD